MRYNHKISGERIRKCREEIRCNSTRDENDHIIIEILPDDTQEGKTMSQDDLLRYMRQNNMDCFGRNKLSQLENGDPEAFDSVSLGQWNSLCEMFNVDFDYLTGKIDCKTHDLQFIHDYTGLSEESIKDLHLWKNEKVRSDNPLKKSQIIDMVLTQINNSDLFNRISTLITLAILSNDGSPESEKIRIMASHEVSNSFRFIADNIFNKFRK